jgi:hypothetical protein
VQTLGNQIVVLGNGVLVNTFDLIDNGLPPVAVQRSTDRGLTWSGDLLPEAAADLRRGTDDLYIVWQDIGFTLAAPLPYFNDQIVIAGSTDGGLTGATRSE